MNRRIQKWCLTVMTFFIGAGLLLNVPFARADPPPWAHGHKHKHMYQYYYYPAQQVYYSPVKRVYYYQDNGAWIYNPSPPASIHLGNKVRIDLGSSTPYVEHPYVIQQYPAVIVR